MISGNGLVNFPGGQIRAGSGKKAVTLRAVVLDRMTVKISIYNVQMRDENGAPAFHAKKPCDPDNEVKNMNLVWTLQANIDFDLVSSGPLLLDDGKKSVREAIAKALGLNAKEAPLPAIIDPVALEGVFKDLRDEKNDGSDFTFFLVDKLQIPHGDIPTGKTRAKSGFAYIAATHSETTFAHEMGHYLGGEYVAGEWTALGHLGEKLFPASQYIRLLMRDGGSGWKISFEEARKFRGFFERRKGKKR